MTTKTIIVNSVLIILFSCSTKDSPNIVIDIIPENEMKFQKMIISQLTGEQKINTLKDGDIFLKSRWDKEERRITLDYFESLFKQLPEVSYYKLI